MSKFIYGALFWLSIWMSYALAQTYGLLPNGTYPGTYVWSGTNTWTGTNTFSSTVSGIGITSLFASPPTIGSGTPNVGSFTNLSSSGTVSGTGFSNYLASPPAIGGTAPAAVSATAPAQGDSSSRTITSAWYGQNYSGGFINKFRNANFEIWQRGTSGQAPTTSVPGAYTADGWQVQQTGAAFTCARITSSPTPPAGSLAALGCVGGTSNTDTKITGKIESFIAAPLANVTVTVQFKFQQNTGSSVTPKISTCFASAQDNFATCTADLASTSLTACASGVWCTEAFTFTPSASATNGYEVTIDCNTALTAAQSCYIAQADIRSTPGVTGGINATPPSPELRPTFAEMPYNLRYFYFVGQVAAFQKFAFGMATATTTAIVAAPVPAVMRVAPTLTYDPTPGHYGLLCTTSSTSVAATGISTDTSTPSLISINVTVASGCTAGSGSVLQANNSLSPFIAMSSEL